MRLQSCESPNLGDFETPIWESWEKNHLNVGSTASHIVYYKREGGGFPQIRAVVNLVCPCFPWLVLAPKVFQLCTNHFVLILCTPMWMSEVCQLFLVSSQSSSTPFYPSQCCEPGSMPRLFPLSLFSTWAYIWIFQRVGSASDSIGRYEIFGQYFNVEQNTCHLWNLFLGPQGWNSTLLPLNHLTYDVNKLMFILFRAYFI
jgi:hypothetical protein